MRDSDTIMPNREQLAAYRAARWRVYTPGRGRATDGFLREWLLEPSSLTARLRAICPGGFAVKLLDQGYAPIRVDERRSLGIAIGHQAFVREVLLTCRGEPWVFARTVIPRSVAQCELRSLTRLGTRPLGEVLFSSRDLVRKNLQLARISGSGGEEVSESNSDTRVIWGRRSIFLRARQPLLVSEVFLPAFAHFLKT